MNTSCTHCCEWIPQVVAGEADEARRAETRRHAEQCPECAAQMAFQERLQGALALGAAEAPSALYFEGVLAELHQRMPAIALRCVRPRRRLRAQSVASGLMAALLTIWIGAGGSLMTLGGPNRLSHRPSASSSTLHHADGAPPPRVALVAVEGMGLVSANSEYFKMTVADRRALGLPEHPRPPRLMG